MIFQSVIVSRLLYGLSSAWLNKADVRRLNGFQARCLRKILRIAPSYYSRISNHTVLERAGQEQLGTQLRRQQLILYGRIARANDEDVLRRLVFVRGLVWPITDTFVRKGGRPKNEWAKQLFAEATGKIGYDKVFDNVVRDRKAWESLVLNT